MTTDTSQLLELYLSLSVKEKIAVRAAECEKIYNKVKYSDKNFTSPLQSAASQINALFIKRRIAYQKNWIGYAQYSCWMHELKTFLLDPDLYIIPELYFLELITEVNNYII